MTDLNFDNTDLSLIFFSYDSDKKVKDEIVKTISGTSYSKRSELINGKGVNNITPLMLSVTNGYIETTTYLIEKGANKDDCDDDGNTALHICSQNGHEQLVLLLLDKNSNPNLKNKNGDTPLLLAAFRQHKHIIQIFKNKGLKMKKIVDKELKEYPYHRKPLNNIIFDEKNELEKYLKQNLENNNMDIDLKLPIGDGVTLLMVCAILDHTDCLQILISYKAHVDIIDNHGRTALLRACGRGNIKAVRLLVKENANINLASDIIDNDNGYLTPLMASVSNTDASVASVLLENSADVTCLNSHKETALHMAVKYGSEECIKLIVPKCIDNGIINAVNDNEDTCLHIAARFNCSKTIIEDLLVVKDRDIANDPTEKERKNLQGETALIIAVRMGHINVVYALLDNGVSLLTKGEKSIKGMTPLMVACSEGNWEIVHILCDRIRMVHSKTNSVIKLQYSDDDEKTYINSKLQDSEDNALLIAIKGAANHRGNNGYSKCIRILVDSGIDVYATNKKQETGLIIAVREGLVDIVKILLHRKSNQAGEGLTTAASSTIVDTFTRIQNSVEFVDIITTLNCAVKIEGRENIIELANEFAFKKFPSDQSYRDEPIKLAILSRRLEYLWRHDGSNLLWYDEWVEGKLHVTFFKAVLRNDIKTIDRLTKGKTNDLSINSLSRSLNFDGFNTKGKYESLSSKSSAKNNDKLTTSTKKTENEVNTKTFCCSKVDDVVHNMPNIDLIQSNLKYLQEIELSDITHNISDITHTISNIDITKNISDMTDAMGLGLSKRWYEARDKTGSTVLLWSAALGLNELASILINRCDGIDINIQHTETQSTPLMLSAKYGHLSFVKLMIENGAFKELVNASNRTALAIAARKNQVECVKYLIKEAPPMLEMRDMFGRTPLLNAIKPYSKEYNIDNVSFEVVKILLNNKADVSVRDYEGKTALTHALDYRHESVESDKGKRKVMEIVELLLLNEAKDSDGKVPSDVVTTEILFINSSVLKSSRDPLSIIHKFYKKNDVDETIPIVTELERIIFDRRILERIFTFQHSLLTGIIIDDIIIIIILTIILLTAAYTHIFDSTALKEKANEIDLILEEMFMSESLQHDNNVIKLLFVLLLLLLILTIILILDIATVTSSFINS